MNNSENPTTAKCPECAHDLMAPAPDGEPGDDTWYCEGCGRPWNRLPFDIDDADGLVTVMWAPSASHALANFLRAKGYDANVTGESIIALNGATDPLTPIIVEGRGPIFGELDWQFKASLRPQLDQG